MAGFEKCCEMGTEIPENESWNMYYWKENLIQVHPSKRKLFRGKVARLIIHEGRWVSALKVGGKIYSYGTPSEHYPLLKNEKFIKQWFYTLKVYDQEVLGNVGGEYYNWTFELGTTIRKLKELVGGGNLEIVYEKPIKRNSDYLFWDIVKNQV